METIAWLLWGALWTLVFVRDGALLGAGALLPFAARREDERHALLETLRPAWRRRQGWLLAAFAFTFAAFPHAFALMLPVLFAPAMLLLVAQVLRGAAFELRGFEDDANWRSACDGALAAGSALSAFLFGLAGANVLRGLLFTVRPPEYDTLHDLLSPYALLGGALFLALFVAAGATRLAHGPAGPAAARARRAAVAAAAFAGIAFVALALFSGRETPLVGAYRDHGILYALPLAALAGLAVAAAATLRAAGRVAAIGHAVAIAAVTWSGLAGLWPRVFWSRRETDPAALLTLDSAANRSLAGTAVGLCVAGLVAALAVAVLSRRARAPQPPAT